MKTITVPTELWNRIKDALDGASLCDHDTCGPVLKECEELEKEQLRLMY